MINIYIPIEFKSREYQAKLALAIELIKRGFRVLIGQQWSIYSNLDKLFPGVILFKSNNKIHHPAMKAAKASGHIVLVLEEETMATCTEYALKKYTSIDLYNLVDYIFVHGDFEKKFHEKQYNIPSKLIKTGNPRIDILKKNFRFVHQNEIDSIKNKFGKFILINTNFQATNSFMGTKNDYIDIAISGGAIDPKDGESLQSYVDYIDWEEECVIGIEKIINKLSVLYRGKLKIIVRPHPGEVLGTVHKKYNHLNNVEVLRIGSHIPWTLASQILIHPTCTTGLEAAVANKNAVSYLPRSIWYSDQTLSNQVNACIDKVDDIISYTEKYLENDSEFISDFSRAHDFIFNLTEISSIKIIADFIEKLIGLNSYPRITKETYKGIMRQNFQIEKCSIQPEEILQPLKLFIENDPYFKKQTNKKIKVSAVDNSLYSLEFS